MTRPNSLQTSCGAVVVPSYGARIFVLLGGTDPTVRGIALWTGGAASGSFPPKPVATKPALFRQQRKRNNRSKKRFCATVMACSERYR